MMKYVFTFDPNRCSACSSCMIACTDQNDIDLAAGGEMLPEDLRYGDSPGRREGLLRVPVHSLHAL